MPGPFNSRSYWRQNNTLKHKNIYPVNCGILIFSRSATVRPKFQFFLRCKYFNEHYHKCMKFIHNNHLNQMISHLYSLLVHCSSFFLMICSCCIYFIFKFTIWQVSNNLSTCLCGYTQLFVCLWVAVCAVELGGPWAPSGVVQMKGSLPGRPCCCALCLSTLLPMSSTL